MSARPCVGLLAGLLLVAPACESERPPAAAESSSAPSAEGPPGARPELVAMLREDRDRPVHPGDGGGRAWLEEGPTEVRAGGIGSWTVVYEAGEHGVAVGGAVYLLASPFWGWSSPQTQVRGAPGYTEVSTDAEGVSLDASLADAQLLAVAIGGRALAPGERLRFVYGAGALGARADRFAERQARLWVGVDADGDGVRAWIAEPPAVDVVAGPPAGLVATLASTARPGDAVRLTLAVLDAAGNAGPRVSGEITLALPEGLEGPASVALAPEDAGRCTLALTARRPGVYRVTATGPGELRAESNPLVVDATGPSILWADLHGHSQLSDGTGTPEDYFVYAREVAGLDVAALTDHDHWGLRYLDQTPALWARIRAATAAAHEPGRFVTLLGFEWTSWIHGHRHVLYFTSEGAVVSSLDEATDEPQELWARLRGQPALTFAHHSAGGPIPTNWDIPPDPVLEPVTEVASVHGSSEALDGPKPIYSPVPGNFVRDVLDRGYRLGFVGSGDSHDGHPGLAHLAAPSGGLAAIVGAEPTREGVLAALRARRTYATNGPRLAVRAELGGVPQGGSVPPGDAPRELRLAVSAPGPLAKIELVRSGQVGAGFAAEGRRDLELGLSVSELKPSEYLYLRVVQEDGGAAWTSPWFVEGVGG